MSNNLTSIIFPLTATTNATLPVENGRIAQGALLNWLQQDKPELAVKLHDQYQRFYTVSGLQGEFEREKRHLRIAKGRKAWFRVTAMNEEISAALLEIAEKRQTGPALDDPRWAPGKVVVTPDQHEWVRLTSFAEMVAEVEKRAETEGLAPEVILRFFSPTCFIENEQSLPLPVPRYLFGYLFNQWQRVSPLPLPVEEPNHFIDNIHLAYASIKTQFVDFKKFRRVGFVGLARFGLHPKFPPLYRMLLHLLAEFAFFSGVGSHTAMGMGQAGRVARSSRRIKSGEEKLL